MRKTSFLVTLSLTFFTACGDDPAVSVTAVSPTGGSVLGGRVLTVSGANFVSGTTVTVGGSPCTSVTVPSSTSLTCLPPARGAGAADVIATNPNGSASGLASAYTYGTRFVYVARFN